MRHRRFPRYVSVGEKRARAEKRLKQLKKKNPDIQPVVVEGRTIAKTWWGKSWNDNLERYADFANRIGRGRSYVRHRTVLDLKIEPGRVIAMVQGSRAKPYNVEIRIKALGKKTWADIKKACSGKFDSLQALLAGKFPESLSDIFTARGKGLFPSPHEIDLSCSCPDWAIMCKHVAATLYGIGVRLDEDPSLFFTLRKVEMMDLVTGAMAETTDVLLKKAETKKEGVIEDADLADLFGIDMEDTAGFDASVLPKPRRSAPKKKLTAAPVAKKKAIADARARVLDLVTQSSKGVDVPTLKKETGLDTVKIRNIVFSAYKKGSIARAGRGLYKGKPAPIDSSKEAESVLSLIQKSPGGIGVPEIKEITRIPDARVRYIVSRAYARGDIVRLARGIYAAPQKAATPANTSP